ncbi:hypothetical protein [Dapis sp. BLCC M172]|uniref:hypothetical protein n=1 Tax=Dapis sp. BLCC M172 TaxID=2975281 RepID=UPI003CF0C8C5
MVEFRAKLFFNDNSSFSFSGIKSFQEYENKERRNLICTGFIFTWVYLVEFHDKKVPERQEISVSSVESVEEDTLYFVDQVPKISYYVRCTNQGWGIEIGELVRNCIIGFVKTNVPLAGFRRKAMNNHSLVGFFSFILVFLLSFVFFWIYSQERLTSCRSFSDQIAQFIGDNILLAEKVDFLIKFFNTCQVTNLKENIIIIFLFFTLFSFFTSILFSILMSELIFRLIKLPTYRFLIFTEASKRERDKYFRRVSNRKNFWWIVVVAGLIIGVSASILASYLLEWLGNTFS